MTSLVLKLSTASASKCAGVVSVFVCRTIKPFLSSDIPAVHSRVLFSHALSLVVGIESLTARVFEGLILLPVLSTEDCYESCLWRLEIAFSFFMHSTYNLCFE